MTSAKQAGSFIGKISCFVKLMYRNFFSLSELPFSISPDPKYLFMSERHKEALSHLTYGLGEVGGFALLTGEVGTGKTTVSRCLMEQLPENTQAAFILNPTLSSQELLATICDQFKIRYRKSDASLKILTDKISEKLLKNHENDINTLLIIDEAQHLQPEVLEQLRLLTNLETNTKKLLQVILIGQPELQQLLQRRDLRQLAQRITARYHLMPLTKPELQQYIEHRLQVANCARPVFDKAALTKLHQFSQGIPRLINLLCHSALMLAYNQNDSVVNKKTVIAAAQRALGDELNHRQNNTGSNKTLLITTALSITAFATLAGFWWGQTQTSQQAETVESVAMESIKKPVSNALTKSAAAKLEVNPEDVNHKEINHEQALSNAEPKQNDKLTDNQIDNQTGKQTTESLVEKKTRQAVIESAPEPQLVISSKSNQIVSDNTLSSQVVDSSNSTELSENTNAKVDNNQQYQISEVDGVSDDLMARFQAAIDATAQPQENTAGDLAATKADDFVDYANTDVDGAENIKPLSQMSSQLQNALPRLQFEQHIYASDGQGWVNVNGRDRYEGDYISDNLIVDKILPQHVVLSFQGEKFTLPALTNW